jgi:hypothetical protein
VIAYVAGGVLAVVVLIAAAAGGVVAALFGGGGAATGEVCLGTVTNPGATPAGLSPEQARNAAVIVAVGQRMKGPRARVGDRGSHGATGVRFDQLRYGDRS